MEARKITGTDLPPMFPMEAPTTLFMMGKEVAGERFFAVRGEAPHFVIEGSDPAEVFGLADNTISNFLAKMARFGFRN